MTTVEFTDLDKFAEGLAATHPDSIVSGGPDDQKLEVVRGGRRRWQPVLARVYGIRPWEMGRLTFRELQAIIDDAEAISG